MRLIFQRTQIFEPAAVVVVGGGGPGPDPSQFRTAIMRVVKPSQGNSLERILLCNNLNSSISSRPACLPGPEVRDGPAKARGRDQRT